MESWSNGGPTLQHSNTPTLQETLGEKLTKAGECREKIKIILSRDLRRCFVHLVPSVTVPSVTTSCKKTTYGGAPANSKADPTRSKDPHAAR